MPQLRAAHYRTSLIVQDARSGACRKGVTQADDRQQVIWECLRDLNGVDLIYAIRCSDGLIKIGWTRDLMSRRRHFTASDAPENILAITPGTYAEEQELHASLRASVARGQEYYHPTAEVLAYVNGLRTNLGVGPIE